MHARYELIGDRPTLEFERPLSHPIEAVWRAITEPEELAHWFPSAVELELRPGGPMTFQFPDGETVLHGEVIALDRPRLFSFTWGDDDLRFELEPDGGGTRLRLTVALDARNKAARDAAGWHMCLDALERVLEGGPVEHPSGSGEWRGLYAEYTGRGLPTGAPVPGT
jgi:uncharacterized protein YndB with AHSA1/START domain